MCSQLCGAYSVSSLTFHMRMTVSLLPSKSSTRPSESHTAT